MLSFDQVALHTKNIDETIRQFKITGHREWIQDTVHAEHIFKHKSMADELGERFVVRLAFNYDVIPGNEIKPGIEFELIELIDGRSYQIANDAQVLSHFGYHTKTDQAETGPDSLLTELLHLQSLGFEVMQISQTTSHTGTGRRYRYAYVDRRLGAPVKIIQRLLPIKSTELQHSLRQGRELFECLS